MNSNDYIEAYKNYRESKKVWDKLSKTLKILKDDCNGFFRYINVFSYDKSHRQDELNNFLMTFGLEPKRLKTLEDINSPELFDRVKQLIKDFCKEKNMDSETYKSYKELEYHFEKKQPLEDRKKEFQSYFKPVRTTLKILENKGS